jgi:hypothetical protein
MVITIRTHYLREDTEFIYDYASVDVLVDGAVAVSYGDYYHDKGSEKAQGFVAAVEWLHANKHLTDPKLEIKHEEVADYDG